MVFDKIKAIIVEQLGVDEDKVTMETHLMKLRIGRASCRERV